MDKLRDSLSTRAGSLYGAALILLVFFLPSLIYGTVTGYDLRFHVSWFASFEDAVRHGAWYPRWLPDQMAGMGSPTLYFYPPFATFFVGLVDLLTLNRLPELRVFAGAAVLMALLSGCTFYVWARRFSDGAMAVWVSAFYAVAPYHLLIDYYSRAAMAEYAAYIWLPLIFAGIQRVIVDGGRAGVLILSAGIAGLFYTHLLTAMIFGPFALAYALLLLARLDIDTLRQRGRVRRFGLLAMTGACGVGLAALYFVPAIALLKDANAHALNLYPVYNTTLFRGLRKPDATFPLRMSVIAATYFIMTACLVIQYFRARRRQTSGGGDSAPVLFWAGAILLVTVTMAGAFGFIFEPPSPFEQIQFLWRMLMFVEFAALSIFLCVWQQCGARVARIFAAAAIPLLLWQGSLLVVGKFEFADKARVDFMQTVAIKNRLSPSEYFPSGTTFTRNVEEIMTQLAPHIAKPAAEIVRGEGTILRSTLERATFNVEILASTETQVGLHQFYFPGWRAVDDSGRELSMLAAGNDRVASFIVGPGRHTVTVTRVLTLAEQVGTAVSVIALLALIVLTLLAGRVAATRAPICRR